MILMSIEEDNNALSFPIHSSLEQKRSPDRRSCCSLSSSIVFHRPGTPDVTGLRGVRQVVEMIQSTSTDQHSTRFTHQSDDRAQARGIARKIGNAECGRVVEGTRIAHSDRRPFSGHLRSSHLDFSRFFPDRLCWVHAAAGCDSLPPIVE